MNSLVGFALDHSGIRPKDEDVFDASLPFNGNTNVNRFNQLRTNIEANTCADLSGSDLTDCDYFVKHRQVNWNNTSHAHLDLRMWF